MQTHEYCGIRIPVMTSKSARPFYNLPDDEIDRLRTGQEFDADGDCRDDGFRGTPFEDRFMSLPEQEIRERAEFLEREKAGIFNLMLDAKVPCKDQNGHGYCWCYGAVSAIEAARLKEGLPYVELNPHSTAARVKNGRDQGGWANEALRGAEEYGVMPASHWNGHSRDTSQWRDADKAAEAAKYKPKEWVDIPRGDMAALQTLLASNFACGIGLMWWGHLVVFTSVAFSNKHGPLYLFRNSHSKRFANDGWCFATESVANHGGGSTVYVA